MKKSIKVAIITGVMLGFVFAVGIPAQSSAAMPDSVTIPGKKPVKFPHKKHEAALAGKCTECHASATGGKDVKLKGAAFHGVCKKCHKDGGKGPTGCKEGCHTE